MNTIKIYVGIASVILLFSSCWETMQERKQKAAEYRHLSFVAGQKGNYEEALFYDNEAIKLDDKNPLSYCNRGYDKEFLRDTLGAISDYKKAISLDTTWEEPLCNLATLYARQHKTLEAKNLFLKAINVNSNVLIGYYGLGALSYSTQRYDSAIKYFELVIEKYPIAMQQKPKEGTGEPNIGNAEIMVRTYYYIGLCYKHIGDKEKAKENLLIASQYNVRGAEDSLKAVSNLYLEKIK